jgi:hypothetical protein
MTKGDKRNIKMSNSEKRIKRVIKRTLDNTFSDHAQNCDDMQVMTLKQVKEYITDVIFPAL